jgi:hypothetical protein
MAQKIKQANIFGRLGSALGKGLAESIPKEAERIRRSQSFDRLAQEDMSNLTPMQRTLKISGNPYVAENPQLLQTLGKLSEREMQKEAYKNLAGQSGNPLQQAQVKVREEEPQRLGATETQRLGATEPQRQRSKTVGVQEQQRNIPGENAYVNVPAIPFTREEEIARKREYMAMGFTPEQSDIEFEKDKAERMARPQAYEERRQFINKVQSEGRQELDRQLALKLQKNPIGQVEDPNNIYKDLTGEEKVRLEREMDKELRLNPNANIKDLADDFSQRAFNMSKAKNALNKLGSNTGIENFLPKNTDDTLRKLREYQNIFKKAGNLEEYKNLLITDFGMSEQGASNIAYPRNNKIKEYISNYKKTPLNDLKKLDTNARRAANEIGKMISGEDSILAIASDLTAHDPNFNQEAFFDELGLIKEDLMLNDRLNRELTEGRDTLPSWGDIRILPIFKR